MLRCFLTPITFNYHILSFTYAYASIDCRNCAARIIILNKCSCRSPPHPQSTQLLSPPSSPLPFFCSSPSLLSSHAHRPCSCPPLAIVIIIPHAAVAVAFTHLPCRPCLSPCAHHLRMALLALITCTPCEKSRQGPLDRSIHAWSVVFVVCHCAGVVCGFMTMVWMVGLPCLRANHR